MYYQPGSRVKKEKTHFRNCPRCSKKIGYTSAAGRDRAIVYGGKCRACATSLDKTGKPHSAELKAKMSASQKGRTCTAEHRANMSAAKIGVPLSDETKASMSASRKAYKKSVKDAYTKVYGDKYQFSGFYFTKWSIEVKDRDNGTCQKCSTKKTTKCSLHAHHIVPSQYFMARALDIDNGITLCSSCHSKVHAELDTYTLKGVKFTANDFQNHLIGFITNGPIKDRNDEPDTERAE